MAEKIRINLVHNNNQSIKTLVLLPATPAAWPDLLLKNCKNKLKLKQPLRFFVKKINHPHVLELQLDDAWDSISLTTGDSIFVSPSQDYIGKEPVIRFSLDNQNDTIIVDAEVRWLDSKSYVDPVAKQQLEQTATLDGMKFCIGMPDLHAGNQFPIGAVFGIQNQIYPALIGGDIGCGMSLYQLSLKAKQLLGKQEKISNRIQNMEGPWEGDISTTLDSYSLPSTQFDSSLGTIGRGNHFAELQVIEKVVDRERFEQLGFNDANAYLVVHSGSRGLGKYILEKHTGQDHNTNFTNGTEAFDSYMDDHRMACEWARCNRKVIANRIFSSLNLNANDQSLSLDIWHNNVEEKQLNDGTTVYLHRKGAAPTDKGLIVIPGSRGTFTYLVEPTSNDVGHQLNGYSVAHGAGRLKPRSKLSSSRQLGKYSNTNDMIQKLTKNKFGGITICEDVELLCEESTDAYKDITNVIEDLEQFGLIRVLAILKPIITYKMRRQDYS
ncbi:hypothetical protein HDV02_000435 [Globomyces sp. JEL0801]|nr:hypothetical protein HDV02_000435 [Globomyces sp. JEL0801]